MKNPLRLGRDHVRARQQPPRTTRHQPELIRICLYFAKIELTQHDFRESGKRKRVSPAGKIAICTGVIDRSIDF
jgi:hypothetical protein